LTIRYSEIAGPGIGEPIPGLIVKQIPLVGAKDTVVAKPTKLRDTHQQQQKQQSPLRFL